MDADRISIQQAALFAAQLLIIIYFCIVAIALIVIGLAMAFYFPDWTPLEVLR